MAKKRTISKPARMPMAAPPMNPQPTIQRLQSSGMMKMGDMMMQPPAVIASRMQKPTGRKPAGGKGRRK